MEQHEDAGTKKDLVLYPLEAAKENLNSAKILLDAYSYKAANNREPIMQSLMLSMLYMH